MQNQSQTSFSPPKFTIVRQGSSAPNTSFTADTELSGTNIFDMPVVFADSEGNIDEDSSNISDNSVIEIPSDHSTGTTAKKVILKASNISTFVNAAPTQTVTITKNKNILIQKPVVPSKMLVLNGNVIGRSIPASNIVLPKSSIQPQPIKIQKIVTTGSSVIPTTSIDMKNRQQIPSSKKIEILNNQIIKPAMTVTTASTAPKSVGFVNLADAKPIAANRLSIPFSTVKGSQGQQIVIKAANLKQFTLSGHKQLGNLTVKKVNVVPSTATTIASSDQQQQPKIIFKNA
jgi:regulatory NSL complex subunit 3